MANIEGIVQQLKDERDRIDEAIAALSSLNGKSPTRARSNWFSAAARRRMSIAQKARRAKEQGKTTKRRKISAAGLARIRAAQKRRWAKARAGKK